mmetsp:Transcript_30549/g.73766  ORF Transcript_30549/g.73766 Transcript_30549/m.73766 type:complete len:214 (-) Transcript_30549:256-897(-)
MAKHNQKAISIPHANNESSQLCPSQAHLSITGGTELVRPIHEERHQHIPMLPPRIIQRGVSPFVREHQKLRGTIQEQVQQFQIRRGAPARVVHGRASEVVAHAQRHVRVVHEEAYHVPRAPATREVDERLAEAISALQVVGSSGGGGVELAERVDVVGTDGVDRLLIVHFLHLHEEIFAYVDGGFRVALASACREGILHDVHGLGIGVCVVVL